MVTTAWHLKPLHKCDFIGNLVPMKDRLLVCRLFIPQRKPKLGCTKPLTGPQIAHSYTRHLQIASYIYRKDHALQVS